MSEEELNSISPEEELEAPAPESEVPAEEAPVEQVAEEGPEQKKRGWVVAVLTILGILLLCCVLATCITAAIAIFSGGDTATPLPPTEATVVPTAQPTQQPTDAYIKIDEPVQGAVLDITKPVVVKGTGAGLPEATSSSRQLTGMATCWPSNRQPCRARTWGPVAKAPGR